MTRQTTLRPHHLLAFACALTALTSPVASAEEPWVVDQSYVADSGQKVVKQTFVVEAPIRTVWELYTTAAGMQSWAAPAVEIDLRIGGMLRSNFTAGTKIGDPGTVTSEITNLIPGQEITVRDDLIHLLTLGGLHEWVEMFPESFLRQLENEGDDVFTTTRFEAVGEKETRLTVFSYGYGTGANWERVHDEAKQSNLWFFNNLAKRIAAGPID